MTRLTVDVNFFDEDFDESAHPRKGGKFASAAVKVGAPSSASKLHGGGLSWATGATHAEGHKQLLKGGFVKQSSKTGTNRQKMGRSEAHSSSKEQRSSYGHPEGHRAELKTSTQKYSSNGPTSYFTIHPKES
jgi:hypothetical protein